MNTSAPLVTLTNMARQLLTAQPGIPIDKGAVERAVAMVAPIVEVASGSTFSAEDLAAVARSLESLFVVEQGESLALRDRRRPPDWYLGERRKPGPFMDRYLQKLAEDNWPVKSVEALKESTARVLEMLDDPRRDGPWDWRGLVVGDVQSGKTAHYAGVISRAADAGYRVIVVLAGMHNVLRLQTQQRLEADFLGYDTDPDSFTDSGRKVIGVGRINPRLIVDSLTLAVPNGGDFSVQIARQANFAPLSQPCLFGFRDLMGSRRPQAARSRPRGSTVGLRPPPASRGLQSANRPPPRARLQEACRTRRARPRCAAPARGLDLGDYRLPDRRPRSRSDCAPG